MTTFKDYHDLYLMTDVILFNVVQHFRRLSERKYDLDLLHYYLAPGLSWDAMLKLSTTAEYGNKTTRHLDLITDSDQGLFTEKGIHGGISMISNRYGKANIPEVPDYDPTKPKTWIQYLDTNSCYGWAMQEPLPESNFRFLSKEEIDSFDINVTQIDDEKGYILEVDLHYPPSFVIFIMITVSLQRDSL